jgi:hypothetical protein
MVEKRYLFLTMPALALASLLGNTPAAFAEERVCRGTIGAVTLDNVLVPDGRSCALNGTRLKGTLKVSTGATLSASGVRVNGNIQAKGASAVYINPGSIIGGSVQIKQGGRARLDRARISGDLQLESNSGAVRATQNRVGSNLQVFQNTGGVTLLRNVIAQNLQCKENSRVIFVNNNFGPIKEELCKRKSQAVRPLAHAALQHPPAAGGTDRQTADTGWAAG